MNEYKNELLRTRKNKKIKKEKHVTSKSSSQKLVEISSELNKK